MTLKLLVTVPPTISILISFIFLHFYPITEKTRKRTKALLAEKRYGVKIDTVEPPIVEKRTLLSTIPIGLIP